MTFCRGSQMQTYRRMSYEHSGGPPAILQLLLLWRGRQRNGQVFFGGPPAENATEMQTIHLCK